MRPDKPNAVQRIAGVLAISMFCALSVSAQAGVLFIFDGSNSMRGKIGAESKMSIARRVLGELLNETPADLSVGLMAYGHSIDKDAVNACSDIELVSGIGARPGPALTGLVNGLAPKGRTPIANALGASAAAFAGKEEEANHVVLISDGVESCDGDPCAAAKALRESGVKPRVHVIGFALSAKESQQLECISKLGDGLYLAAADAKELKSAFATVREQVAAAPQATFKEVFRDDFDGEELGEAWSVENPDPEAFIVEEDALLTVSTGGEQLAGNDKMANMFRLDEKLPKGDWRVTARFVPEVQTFRETFAVAIHKDKKTMLSANARLVSYGNHFGVKLFAEKVSKGEVTRFETVLWSQTVLDADFSTDQSAHFDGAAKDITAINLRITKTGRKYTVGAKIEGTVPVVPGEQGQGPKWKKPQWFELQALTSLRAPGTNVMVTTYQAPFVTSYYEIEGGESLNKIDSVSLEVAEKK